MRRQAIQIEIPQNLREFIEKLIQTGTYKSVNDVIFESLREFERHFAQSAKTQKRLDDLLLGGLSSGGPVRFEPSEWDEMNEEANRLSRQRRDGA